MLKLMNVFFMLFIFHSCTSVEDAGRMYFTNNNLKGVEPYHAFMERMKKDQKLRDIMYGQATSAQIVRCTLLRNQIYVASLKGPSSPELLEAVKLMEMAYQENDEAFLAACDHIIGTPLGQKFMAIQQHYVVQTNR